MAAGKSRRRKEQRAYKARHEAVKAIARAEAPIRAACPITDISTLIVSPADVRRAGTASEGPRWVVVSCAPMGERKAIASLRERRIWAYLPIQRFCRYSRGRKQVIERPLMVGYLFAVLPVGWHPDDMQMVAGIDGVLKKMDGRAAIMDPWVLVQLGAMEASGSFDHSGEIKSPFSEGQAVKITGGLFMGHLATVLSINGDHVRVSVESQNVHGTIPLVANQIAPQDAAQAA